MNTLIWTCAEGTAGLVYVIGRKLFANHHTHAVDGVRHVAAKIVITITGKKSAFLICNVFHVNDAIEKWLQKSRQTGRQIDQ